MTVSVRISLPATHIFHLLHTICQQFGTANGHISSVYTYTALAAPYTYTESVYIFMCVCVVRQRFCELDALKLPLSFNLHKCVLRQAGAKVNGKGGECTGGRCVDSMEQVAGGKRFVVAALSLSRSLRINKWARTGVGIVSTPRANKQARIHMPVTVRLCVCMCVCVQLMPTDSWGRFYSAHMLMASAAVGRACERESESACELFLNSAFLLSY